MAMVKAPFNGQLNSNEIFASIYNMIISQQVFADNISGMFSELVDRVKTDGTLYGDTKLFYATDALKSKEWLNDSEAANLLAVDRPADPSCQAITLDQFRMINISVDNYLTKRAWSTEGAFSSFNSVILGWMRTTKRIYEATLVNSYIGTIETQSNRPTDTIDITAATQGLTGSEKDRAEGLKIAEEMANLFIDLQDISRDFNDYKYLRSYSMSDFYVVWNAAYVNKIKKIDLPTVFHNEGLIEKFGEYVLPARYFGDVQTTAVSASNNKAETYPTKFRSLIETDYGSTHVFPGDEIPYGVAIKANEAYMPNAKIICKVVHNDAVKMMSAFEVGTSFFNPRSLTENHYLIWGYSKPDYLKNYPIVEVLAQ